MFSALYASIYEVRRKIEELQGLSHFFSANFSYASKRHVRTLSHDLITILFLFKDGKSYIELVMKADNSSVPTPSKNPSKRPRVRCDQQSVAQKVCAKTDIMFILSRG